MSKTGHTKKRILGILGEKNETLTDLSDKLELAPSTVSQHLQELVDSGQIRLVRDRPRKWKYYELNRGGYETPEYDGRRWFYARRVVVPIAIVLIVAISAFILYTGSGMHTATAQQVYLAPGAAVPVGSTLFSVSDFPTFYNVNSLIITVDSASIHEKSNNKLYAVPLQAKTFDLIKLNNISSVMSGVKLSNGIYDYIVLNVSNVSAVVNGNEENVILPSGKLIIYGNFNISDNSTNWINLDFDLSHSLHITGNGKVVMLPVIKVSQTADTNLELNGNSYVVAKGPRNVRLIEEYGMDYKGDMMHNFSTPENISVNVGTDDAFSVEQNNLVPIVIKSNSGIVIDENANDILNIEGGQHAIKGILYGSNTSVHIVSNALVQNNVTNGPTTCLLEGDRLYCNSGSGNPYLVATNMDRNININGNAKIEGVVSVQENSINNASSTVNTKDTGNVSIKKILQTVMP